MNKTDLKKEALISVIIPVYNVAPFLERCIRSVISQTYKKLEIIIIDDGSSDGSEKQCDMLAKEDSRIKVIHQKNGGLSAARNTGIDHAHGNYIVFIDSDDYINADYINRLLTAITQNNADMSLCGFTEQNYRKHEQKSIIYSQAPVVQTGKELLENMGTPKWYSCVVAWNKMYKRDLFNKIRFPYGKLHEDEYTTPIILNIAETIAIIPDRLYNYCKNNQSIMGRNLSQKHIKDALLACQDRINFFKNKNSNIYHKAIKALLDTYPGLYYKSSSQKQKEYLHNAFIVEYKEKSKLLPLSNKDKIKFLSFFYVPSLYVILKRFNDKRKHEIF